jgi:hypothetical protein
VRSITADMVRNVGMLWNSRNATSRPGCPIKEPVASANNVFSRTRNFASGALASSNRVRRSTPVARHKSSRETWVSRSSLAGSLRNGEAQPGLKCTPMTDACSAVSIITNPECAPETMEPRRLWHSSVLWLLYRRVMSSRRLIINCIEPSGRTRSFL